MEQTTIAPATSYSDVIKDVTLQIKSKKGLILRRTLLIVWPSLLLVVAYFLIASGNNCENIDSKTGASVKEFYSNFMTCQFGSLLVGNVFIAFGILASIYMYIVQIIFGIEKKIWIDSAFDKKEMTPKQSFALAVKLAPSGIKFYLKLWVRYYLPVFVITLLIIAIAIGLMIAGDNNGTLVMAGVILIALAPIGMLIYLYFLKIKLRNAFFVFLDLYKANSVDFNLAAIRINAVNAVTKSAEFKKILILNLGADSIHAVANQVILGIARLSSTAGIGGQVFGQVTQVYGQELNRQVNSFANSVTAYVFYRLALKQLTGSEQEVNMDIYNLVK